MKKVLAYIPAALMIAAPLFGVQAASLTGASVGADVNAAVNTVTNVTGTSASNASSSTTNSNPTASGSVQATVNTNAAASAPEPATAVVMTRSDLSASDAAGAGEPAMSAASVSTSDDLRSYSRSAMQDDQNMNNMSFASNQVEVGYNEQGRLLDIFPVTMNVKANVDAQGNVTLDYPWYSFLTKNSTNADLTASIKSKLDEDTWLEDHKKNSDGILDAAGQARVAADIAAAMKSGSASSTPAGN